MIQAIPHPTTKAERLLRAYRGLADGSMKQSGGVVRWAINNPPAKPGSIFAHVYQNGLAPARDAVNMAPVLQGQQALQAGQQAIQGLAMATTALSAINLGVSVVGFAVLAHKMNQLQASVKVLEAQVGAGFARVEDTLDSIEARLAGISVLLEHTAHGVDWLRAGSHTALRRIDWLKISELQASTESLADLEAGRRAGLDAGNHAERIRAVRTYLLGVLADMDWPEPTTIQPTVLHQRMLLLALAQALAAEAYAWRLADETDTAARVLEKQAPSYRRLAQGVGLHLVGGDVGLLGDGLLLEEIDSPIGAAVPDMLLDDRWARPVQIRARVSSARTRYLSQNKAYARRVRNDREATVRRIRAGRELTFPLAEAAQNLDGLASEYRALADAGVPRREWEEQQADKPGLYFRAPLAA